LTFSMVGRSETGKTTLITNLVAELKRRGFSVGVVKHCPRGFQLDMEGKDSWKFKEAGADAVLLLSPERLGLVKERRGQPSLTQLVEKFFADADLVLTEGCPDGAEGRKIEVLRSAVSRELLHAPDDLAAVVSDFQAELNLPRFQHDDVQGLADFMEGFMKDSEERKVELRVNGREVNLNPFVQTIFQNTVLGLVSSLKIEGEPKVVELRISTEGSRTQS